MTLTRQEVGFALMRLRMQRREVAKVRALASHPDDLEKLDQIMEWIQYIENQRSGILKKCPC
jgi:hypothetical protein